ncbi:glycosyltransferase family 2 protein [Mesorhizobium sp.]|uniref:glycosyltransferase family 2 protein n=1 Tax=Mesorhizobium sp. TaxID=1871066 RepID=UPI0025D3E809|nr:glycosyltransferase family 2 protein [Mesorhizobium sp.]
MTQSNPTFISVIVTTYNWPEALRMTLQSLAGQTDRHFEVIVADDGSGPPTAELVSAFAGSAPIPVAYVWQEDAGFRRAAIINKAIAESRGDYLIFVDGDCILQPDFVSQHRALAAPRHLVTGSRILLGRRLSRRLLAGGTWSFKDFRRGVLWYRLTGDVSKITALFVRLPTSRLRNYNSFVWRRIKGCNLACWKADAVSVAGFDESFVGWGGEDIDFVFRLQDSGVIRRSGTWATEVLHIWHPPADPSRAECNGKIVRTRIEAARLRRRGRSDAKLGVELR